MKIQEYLKTHSLQQLKDEYKIECREYDDRVVLNYLQIFSPKHDPICDECRALILRKNTWEVLACSFDRFYNLTEDHNYMNFPFHNCRVEEKLDGSILSCAFDGEKWCASTRSMAYAEGTTNMGRTFREIFDEAANKTRLWDILNDETYRPFTFIFELTSPETRVVKPYTETEITLIGVRNNKSGNEWYKINLDEFASLAHIKRPISYHFNSMDEIIKGVESLETMDEGFVLVYERDGGLWRLKVKNSKYLAIAHMRNNGSLSPWRVLYLIMKNEQAEYLQYFECDRKYFSFVEKIYAESIGRILAIYEATKNIISQKDFALMVISQCKYDFESGILFTIRKGKKKLAEVLMGMEEKDARRISRSFNLRDKICREFSIKIDEENS